MEALCYSKFRDAEIFRIQHLIPKAGRDTSVGAKKGTLFIVLKVNLLANCKPEKKSP
jgi:hypothetical protein